MRKGLSKRQLNIRVKNTEVGSLY